MSDVQTQNTRTFYPEVWWAAAFGALAHFGLPVVILLMWPVAAWKIGVLASKEWTWYRQKRNGPIRFMIDGGEIAIWTHRNGAVDAWRVS